MLGAEFKGKYVHISTVLWGPSTHNLNLVNIKAPEPEQGYVSERKICEYFRTAIKAVIIKHRGDQLHIVNSKLCEGKRE